MARRLASEVKEPLFPMQITIETLSMAAQESPGRFGEDFGESIAALRAELENLREVVARFQRLREEAGAAMAAGEREQCDSYRGEKF